MLPWLCGVLLLRLEINAGLPEMEKKQDDVIVKFQQDEQKRIPI